MDPGRLGSQLGGHVGIAVAVGADPAGPVQERRGRGGPGAGLAGIGRRPDRGRPAVARSSAAVQRPDHDRRDPEQGLVEEDHRAADLVERARRRSSAARRSATGGDLLAQPAAQVAVLARVRRGSSSCSTSRAIRRRARSKRPPASLGRVGGQDRRHRQPGDELSSRAGLRPSASSRSIAARQGVLERQRHGRPARAGGAADALALLGHVDHLEVQPEGPDDRLDRGQVERVEVVDDRHAAVGAGRRARPPRRSAGQLWPGPGSPRSWPAAARRPAPR